MTKDDVLFGSTASSCSRRQRGRASRVRIPPRRQEGPRPQICAGAFFPRHSRQVLRTQKYEARPRLRLAHVRAALDSLGDLVQRDRVHVDPGRRLDRAVSRAVEPRRCGPRDQSRSAERRSPNSCR